MAYCFKSFLNIKSTNKAPIIKTCKPFNSIAYILDCACSGMSEKIKIFKYSKDQEKHSFSILH